MSDELRGISLSFVQTAKGILLPVGAVTSTGETGLAVVAEDRPVDAAAALPAVADPAENEAPKLSARLLALHGADPDSVKGHAA